MGNPQSKMGRYHNNPRFGRLVKYLLLASVEVNGLIQDRKQAAKINYLLIALVIVLFVAASGRVKDNDITRLDSTTITSTSPFVQSIGLNYLGQTGTFHYQTDADDAGDTTFVTLQGRNSKDLPWEVKKRDTMVGDGSLYFSYTPSLADLQLSIVTQDTTDWDAAIFWE